MSVILSTGGCLSQCMLGYTPPGQKPLGQTPPQTDTPSPWADTPSSGQTPPPDKTPPRQTPSPGQTPPPPRQATVADGTHPTGMLSCLYVRRIQECRHFSTRFADNDFCIKDRMTFRVPCRPIAGQTICTQQSLSSDATLKFHLLRQAFLLGFQQNRLKLFF